MGGGRAAGGGWGGGGGGGGGWAVVHPGRVGAEGRLGGVNREGVNREGVEYVQRTAGRFKRTINVLTPNTEEGVAAFEKELEVIHTEFKQTVDERRAQYVGRNPALYQKKKPNPKPPINFAKPLTG